MVHTCSGVPIVGSDAKPLAELIAEAFPRLSPKQQRVARFLADHDTAAAFRSANELADQLGVDPATVVRLARALGFRGYSHLQESVRQRFPRYPTFVEKLERDGAEPGTPSLLQRAFAQGVENLRLGLEHLDPDAFAAAVAALGQARCIIVFGGGVATGVVEFLASSLKMMGFRASGVTTGGLSLAQEIAQLGAEDLVVAVGFYRYLRETATALERARDLGVPRLVLTDSPLSPLAALADHALCVSVESTSHRISLVAPMAVADALIAACAASYHDRVAPALRRLDEQYRKAALLMYE